MEERWSAGDARRERESERERDRMAHLVEYAHCGMY